MPAPRTPPNCVRCRQPLTVGSYFCVSCGHNNESALEDRMLDIGNQIEKRRWWLQAFKSVADAFYRTRWFR